jgi:hypothetical protein
MRNNEKKNASDIKTVRVSPRLAALPEMRETVSDTRKNSLDDVLTLS